LFVLFDLVAATLIVATASTAQSVKVTADSGRVLVKGSSFEMGTDESEIPKLMRDFGVAHAEVFTSEVPRHKVKIGSFYIDKFEVTNNDFRKFILAYPQWQKDKIPAGLHNGKYLADWNGNDYPADRGDLPVVYVSWYAAVAYCQARNMRLPTEAEWEYAARGGLSGKAFPWGDQLPDTTLANFSKSGFGHSVKVGSYPPNGYGIYDMAGNVWEYLADEWGSYPRTRKVQIDPVAGGDLFVSDSYLRVSSRRVIRGGSWGGSAINLRVAYRDSHPPTGAGDHVGFRCAASAR
jgi:formylglycine-generating enzyme required for sulfatase activity